MYYGVTTAFHDACKATTRDIYTKCEVINGNSTITMYGAGSSGEIISMEWDNIVCSNDGLQIGTCCMDEFKMKYHPVTTTIPLLNKEIHPYIGVDVNGTVTYVPLGIFYVTNVETEDDEKTFSITAYDGVQKLLGTFNANDLGISFPINAWTLLSAIVTHFGLMLSYEEYVLRLLSSNNYVLTTSDSNKTLVVQQNINANKNKEFESPYEGTYRDYVGWIAGLVGANAHMGRDGSLVIARYASSNFNIGRDVQHMGGAKINLGGSVTYTSVISGTDEDPIKPTNYCGNAITYTNPFITSSELDLICDEIIGQNGITVTPCDVTWRSNPCVDAGDIITVEDKDGNAQTVYVMERVTTVTGGLAETLHCYGETEVSHTLNKSPLTAKFAQMSQDLKDFSDLINGTDGVFQFIDNGDGTNGGFTIYENGSQSWLRCTAGGLGISADGGLTYTNAITKNGVMASSLKVVGDNGNTLLEADDRLDGDEVYFKLGNINGNTFMSATTYISSGGIYQGKAIGDFVIYNPDTGHRVVGVYCNPNNSSLTVCDPDTGNGAISLQSFEATNGNISYIKGSIEIKDPNNDSLPAVFIGNGGSNGSQGFVGVKDSSGTYHSLDIKQITISGTTYYILASTL